MVCFLLSNGLYSQWYAPPPPPATHTHTHTHTHNTCIYFKWYTVWNAIYAMEAEIISIACNTSRIHAVSIVSHSIMMYTNLHTCKQNKFPLLDNKLKLNWGSEVNIFVCCCFANSTWLAKFAKIKPPRNIWRIQYASPPPMINTPNNMLHVPAPPPPHPSPAPMLTHEKPLIAWNGLKESSELLTLGFVGGCKHLWKTQTGGKNYWQLSLISMNSQQ